MLNVRNYAARFVKTTCVARAEGIANYYCSLAIGGWKPSGSLMPEEIRRFWPCQPNRDQGRSNAPPSPPPAVPNHPCEEYPAA